MKQSLPQRKPLRLTAYDYAQNGAYFITICTENRAYLFGDIVDNTMVLNDAGKMVESVWREMPMHYPNILLDAFIIMPNHIHFIIVFIENDHSVPKSLADVINHAPTTRTEPSVGVPFMASANQPTPLGKIVRTFKGKSTFLINQHQKTVGMPVWQRGYYDQIIRNEAHLQSVRLYIENNPAQWAFDEENQNKP
ncbi:MAG: transposase [Candidatus Melainabacteria bacterium]|nr:transposase [Candidatus Melainabacteria bacterium]